MTDQTILFLSGHDYRSPRRANIHFFAQAAADLFADVAFFSVGFSALSRLNGDPRLSLADKANRWEFVDGVRCYLWRSLYHPFRQVRRLSPGLADRLYSAYAETPNRQLDEAISAADVIVVESGLAPIFLPRVVRLNPSARLIYAASDLLETIGVDPAVERTLDAHLHRFSRIRVPSRAMAPAFAKNPDAVVFLPHGLNAAPAAQQTSPYGEGRHAVAVGSMLFDAETVEAIAAAFPDVTFHLIGAGKTYAMPANVEQYGEMPFQKTVPYIAFADVGLAPYRRGPAAAYLADSSMKLRQYGAAKLPSACPDFAVGDYPGRHGYDPDDPESAVAAMAAALADDRYWAAPETRSWRELAAELLK